ncbi:cadherin-2-like [Narcine bancroftii]|uniref:cadherin-2-like n=1 Tax=Narcine bancroftii TaxID=1343680 RepID=UPI003831FE1F
MSPGCHVVPKRGFLSPELERRETPDSAILAGCPPRGLRAGLVRLPHDELSHSHPPPPPEPAAMSFFAGRPRFLGWASTTALEGLRFAGFSLSMVNSSCLPPKSNMDVESECCISPRTVPRSGPAERKRILRKAARQELLVIGFSIWGMCGKAKFQKGGVYHIPVEHESWEDVRENILNYDEEGGGEQDQNGYDISELKKPLRASLSQSSSMTTAPLVKGFTDSHEEKQVNLRTHPNVIFSDPLQSGGPDFKNYVSQIIWDADNDLRALPEDTMHIYCFEGHGSLAGSLSTVNTLNIDEDLNDDYLHDWSTKFKKLEEFCAKKQHNGL